MKKRKQINNQLYRHLEKKLWNHFYCQSIEAFANIMWDEIRFKLMKQTNWYILHTVCK